MELKLIETVENGTGKTNIYNISNYTIRETIYVNGDRYITNYFDSKERFTPDIYPIYSNDGLGGEIVDFKIQTSSYGTLTLEEMRELIKAYKNAIAIIEVLKDKFIKKKKTVWIVEYGSLYDDEPWEIEGVFANEELADKYIKNQELSANLYHKTEQELREN